MGQNGTALLTEPLISTGNPSILLSPDRQYSMLRSNSNSFKDNDLLLPRVRYATSTEQGRRPENNLWAH